MVNRISGQRQVVLEVLGNGYRIVYALADFQDCHLKKGQPTYVAVWQVIDKEIRIVEIKYVGTHEKAPY
jgi:mRNA-degrading endonuclease HigB of HigAB toxin-antitoxin module